MVRSSVDLPKGTDVYGAHQKCQVKVADVGPLLVLKLNAFWWTERKTATERRVRYPASCDRIRRWTRGSDKELDLRAEEVAENPRIELLRGC